MIMNYEKSAKIGKIGKIEGNLLKHKTNRKSREDNLYSEKIMSRRRKPKVGYTTRYGLRKSARTRAKKDHNDYEYDLSDDKISEDYIEDIQLITSMSQESNYSADNLKVIIDKSILFNNYVKEEEEKKSKSHSKMQQKRAALEPLYVNKDLLDTYMTDYSLTSISPMGYRTHLYPLSTRSIDIHYEYSFASFANLLRSPVSVDKYINKEINMTNRILINDINEPISLFDDLENDHSKANGKLSIDIENKSDIENDISVSSKSAFSK
jgi:hypothetical protein